MTNNEQTIIRAPRSSQSPYFPTARKAAQDSRLPFDSRGLLWYILSKPDDWQVQIKDLMREGGIGKERAYRMLLDLEKHGYAQRVEIRTEGRFAGTEYRIFEVPISPSPYPAQPDTVEPYPANPPHTEYRTTQTHESKKNKRAAAQPRQGAGAGEGTPATIKAKSATVAVSQDTPPKAPPAKKKTARERVVHPQHVEGVKQALVKALVESGRWSADDLSRTEYGIAEKVACALCDRPLEFLPEQVGEFVAFVAARQGERWLTYNPAWLANEVMGWRAYLATPQSYGDPRSAQQPVTQTPEQIVQAEANRQLILEALARKKQGAQP